MRLTRRCTDIFRLLRSARWLSTGQIHRRFFSQATLDAARKRLRKHVEERHLVAYREHRMSETLFTLGPEGKRVLEREGSHEIRLERTPPRQLAHFSGVNDLRIAAELATSLSYFFGYWELPALGWQQPVIPDAIFALLNRAFAVEFDRGFEGLKYFLRTKIPAYECGLDGLPLAALIIICDRKARMESLARALSGNRRVILFCTVDHIRQPGFSTPVFHSHAHGESQNLIEVLLSESLLDKRAFGAQVHENSAARTKYVPPIKKEELNQKPTVSGRGVKAI